MYACVATNAAGKAKFEASLNVNGTSIGFSFLYIEGIGEWLMIGAVPLAVIVKWSNEKTLKHKI